MEEVTQTVNITESKREEMIVDLAHLEKERFSNWFKLYCQVMKAELEFSTKVSNKLNEMKDFWTSLETKQVPPPPLSTWATFEATYVISL